MTVKVRAKFVVGRGAQQQFSGFCENDTELGEWDSSSVVASCEESIKTVGRPLRGNRAATRRDWLLLSFSCAVKCSVVKRGQGKTLGRPTLLNRKDFSNRKKARVRQQQHISHSIMLSATLDCAVDQVLDTLF